MRYPHAVGVVTVGQAGRKGRVAAVVRKDGLPLGGGLPGCRCKIRLVGEVAQKRFERYQVTVGFGEAAVESAVGQGIGQAVDGQLAVGRPYFVQGVTDQEFECVGRLRRRAVCGRLVRLVRQAVFRHKQFRPPRLALQRQPKRSRLYFAVEVGHGAGQVVAAPRAAFLRGVGIVRPRCFQMREKMNRQPETAVGIGGQRSLPGLGIARRAGRPGSPEVPVRQTDVYADVAVGQGLSVQSHDPSPHRTVAVFQLDFKLRRPVGFHAEMERIVFGYVNGTRRLLSFCRSGRVVQPGPQLPKAGGRRVRQPETARKPAQAVGFNIQIGRFVFRLSAAAAAPERVRRAQRQYQSASRQGKGRAFPRPAGP